MELTTGLTATAVTTVTQENTAAAVGSGSVAVFATPMMIALMEKAAAGCIVPALQPGQTSVGTQIQTTHSAATPVGKTVTATATVTLVDRRKVVFDVSAHDGAQEIGKGTHTRFIVEEEAFMAKAQGNA
ncbi:thioesterase family protein [Oscillospiraceae bacterium MB08-C2-2]|nr:thioesterase family protein [Oscillospiraceae bacterium MB08-C2-2]